MKEFLLALQFLTIFPVRLKQVELKNFAACLIYFPAVGLFIGFFLAGINQLLFSFPAWTSGVILVISLILITGGMHLDGLSDTFDALSSRKNREDMLAIMKDPHAGVMGMLSIISVILLKISLLASLNTASRTFGLILMAVLSRWSLVGAIFLFPYAKKEGKAKIFSEGINKKIVIMAAILVFIITAFIWPLKGLLLMAIAAITTLSFARIMSRKLGGITGDVLGACNEITEITILLLIVFLTKTNPSTLLG